MRISTKKMSFCAMTAAIYAALTMILSPLSYGALQLRVTETLCVLPFFIPSSAWGLFVGCAIANIISSAGPLDMVFGSAATLAAALCTARIGKHGRGFTNRLFACLMPVVWNGVTIGAVLAWSGGGEGNFIPLFAVTALQVAAGELTVMLLLGLPLMTWIEKSDAAQRLRERFFL